MRVALTYPVLAGDLNKRASPSPSILSSDSSSLSSLLLPLLYELYSQYALYSSYLVLPPSPLISTSLNPIPKCYRPDSSCAHWFLCLHCCHCHPSLVPLRLHLRSAYPHPPLASICPSFASTYLDLILTPVLPHRQLSPLVGKIFPVDLTPLHDW